MKVLCFGDSITWGAWDTQGGWVERLRRKVDQLCIESDLQKFVLLYNLGISSDTSERVLHRVEAETKARSLEDDDLAFLISLGTNDSIWLRDEERHWIERDQFAANLTGIVATASGASDRICLVGSAAVDESKTHPYRSEPNLESSNADIKSYEETCREVAKSARVDFVPIFDRFEAVGAGTLFNDGVHPNDHGHQIIADQVWPTLEAWITGVSLRNP